MKPDQKLNLICRTAGNIFSEGSVSSNDAVRFALKIFKEVEKQLDEEAKEISVYTPLITDQSNSNN